MVSGLNGRDEQDFEDSFFDMSRPRPPAYPGTQPPHRQTCRRGARRRAAKVVGSALMRAVRLFER